MMSGKRFYRASVCGDEGLYDKEDGCIIVNVRSNIDLDGNWNTVVEKLNELSEDNEQLKEYCTMLKNQIKKMGEIGGFNKHMIKTILESNYDD